MVRDKKTEFRNMEFSNNKKHEPKILKDISLFAKERQFL
jgi:hypothetical protein